MCFGSLGGGVTPFAPPSWDLAGEDGTFGNRFDDPSAAHGRPASERFRVVYCASTRAAAFGETVARFRPGLSLLAELAAIEDEEPLDVQIGGLLDPVDRRRGVIPADWRLRRHLASTRLDPSLRFVDVAVAASLQHLRSALAPVAAGLGLADIDLGAVTGSHRRLTQACARYIYEQVDEQDAPRFAGLRYPSRLNNQWECWAIFHDRIRHAPRFPESIFPDEPDLETVAAIYGLAIEVFEGHYVRPEG